MIDGVFVGVGEGVLQIIPGEMKVAARVYSGRAVANSLEFF